MRMVLELAKYPWTYARRRGSAGRRAVCHWPSSDRCSPVSMRDPCLDSNLPSLSQAEGTIFRGGRRAPAYVRPSHRGRDGATAALDLASPVHSAVETTAEAWSTCVQCAARREP